MEEHQTNVYICNLSDLYFGSETNPKQMVLSYLIKNSSMLCLVYLLEVFCVYILMFPPTKQTKYERIATNLSVLSSTRPDQTSWLGPNRGLRSIKPLLNIRA